MSIEPLLTMPRQKNLWVPTRSYSDKQFLTEALINARVVVNNPETIFVDKYTRCPEGLGWRNLKNYYDMRDVLGLYYMNFIKVP